MSLVSPTSQTVWQGDLSDEQEHRAVNTKRLVLWAPLIEPGYSSRNDEECSLLVDIPSGSVLPGAAPGDPYEMVFPLMQLTTRGWIAEWSRVTSGASFVEAGPTLLHCAWTASRQIVNSGVKRLIHAFTSRVGERPQVRKVLLEATGTGPRIWTVIEGEPFKPELRKPIYEAELEAMQISPDVVADFRLVNISEQECDSLDQMLPANAEVVWQR